MSIKIERAIMEQRLRLQRLVEYNTLWQRGQTARWPFCKGRILITALQSPQRAMRE
ncbi:conserved hypothetical protein [Aggregatibacter segnis ATCC 33393]|uniref:Uncharacterized protein n=1 Tax=Aggregatibacter segnis ATCC 33393 TaxID=888057 RepID=E6KWQ2_9PAST|nr:conserved hypothetical protein [Aggregatibacter segnis ATCC 33393]